VEPELPVFKPRRKKKKGRRVLAFLFWTLLLFSFAVVAAVRFLPDFVPAPVMNVLSPLNEIEIKLPLIPWLNTPTSLPAPTQTSLPTDAATVTPLAEAAIATATLSPTQTPIVAVTPTPDDTPVPAATALGGTGEIAFASSRSGVSQIYLARLDGSEPTKLTTVEAGACQPSWSPDGQQLVFTSPCSNRAEFYETSYSKSSLYLINVDGTGLKQLTAAPGPDFDPAWSPDGSRIAFTSMRNGFRQIYLLDVESLAVTLLTDTASSIESSQPAWSPDGTRIVYTVKRVSAYQVWAMTDTGTDAIQLARSGQDRWDFFPVWSPDGKSIFFSQRNKGPSQAWVKYVNFENLSQDPKDANLPAPVENLSFSPDGLWLVFESIESIGNRDIFLMTVDGGGRTRLTSDSKNDFDPAWRPLP
jgi:Tol biopolymer transport system component